MIKCGVQYIALYTLPLYRVYYLFICGVRYGSTTVLLTSDRPTMLPAAFSPLVMAGRIHDDTSATCTKFGLTSPASNLVVFILSPHVPLTAARAMQPNNLLVCARCRGPHTCPADLQPKMELWVILKSRHFHFPLADRRIVKQDTAVRTKVVVPFSSNILRARVTELGPAGTGHFIATPRLTYG